MFFNPECSNVWPNNEDAVVKEGPGAAATAAMRAHRSSMWAIAEAGPRGPVPRVPVATAARLRRPLVGRVVGRVARAAMRRPARPTLRARVAQAALRRHPSRLDGWVDRRAAAPARRPRPGEAAVVDRRCLGSLKAVPRHPRPRPP